MSDDKTYNVLNYLSQPRNAMGLPTTGKTNNTLVINGDTCINGTTRTAEELDIALQDGSDLEPRVDALEADVATLQTDVATNTSNITTNTQDIDIIEAQVLQNGLLTTDDGIPGNLLTAAGPSSINITGGTGQLIDRTGILSGVQPTKTIVSWATETNVDITPLLPFTDGSFPVVKDINGNTLILDALGSALQNPIQYRDYIQIGNLAVSGGVITSIESSAYPAYNAALFPYQLGVSLPVFNTAFDPISIEPSIANPANLRFRINTGSVHGIISGFSLDALQPDIFTNTAPIDPQFAVGLLLRDGSFSFSATNEINPNLLETSPGVTTPVGNGRFSLQRIFLFATSGIIATVYGTEDFNTLGLAVDNAYTSPVPNLPILGGAIHVANLAILEGITDFSQPGVQFSLFDPN